MLYNFKNIIPGLEIYGKENYVYNSQGGPKLPLAIGAVWHPSSSFNAL